MNTQKLIIRVVYSLAGLLFITSIGINIFQHQQFRKLTALSPEKNIKGVSVNDSYNVSGPAPAIKAEKSNTSKNNELQYHLEAAQEELEMTNEQLAEEQSKKEEYKRARAQLSKSLSSSDPARQKRLRKIFTGTIEKTYDPLFKKLDIPIEEFNKVKTILIDREMELSKLLGPYSSASTKEEKDVIVQQEKAIYADYHDKVGDFLGEDKNEIYRSYVDRITERIKIREYMETVSSEKKIGEEKIENLIDSMYVARKAAYDEMNYEPETISSSDITEDKAKQIMEITARIYKGYLEAGRDIMPPELAEDYKVYLKEELEMEEASLKMDLYLNDK